MAGCERNLDLEANVSVVAACKRQLQNLLRLRVKCCETVRPLIHEVLVHSKGRNCEYDLALKVVDWALWLSHAVTFFGSQ